MATITIDIESDGFIIKAGDRTFVSTANPRMLVIKVKEAVKYLKESKSETKQTIIKKFILTDG